MNNPELQSQLEVFKRCTFHYTEHAKREMEKAHLEEEMLRSKILDAKRIEVESPTFLVVFGDKTFKAKVELLPENDVLVHTVSYNKIMVVF